MTLRVPAASIAPDLRFAVADALADPGGDVPIGDMVLRAEGRLSRSLAIPLYLRYADREIVIAADGIDDADELETRLAEHIRATAEAGALDDLSLAVLALDAVDHCFRESGLWPGNIYLAGTGTLAAVLYLAQDLEFVHRRPGAVLRELAALELTYLFPIAGKFRSGEYDGQVQYRLNGWGRALAARLTAGGTGAAQSRALRMNIGQHLASHGWRYASFLSELDVARQDYHHNLLEAALALPIPVLV
jgi:hypothetical protein